MNSFTISQLQDYSGIKAHTIRIWEKRYNALVPNRSDGNTRYYDGDQLRRLLNIVSLLNKNYKISKLCALPNAELNQLVEQHCIHEGEANGSSELFASQLISATLDFDEARFEKLFSNCLLHFGLKNTYSTVLYPVLVRLGMLWSSASLPPAHEHFIVNLIRKKILSAIASLAPAKDDKSSWILFLPEDEFHETGLLMAYYLLRYAGHKVYYLGANVPIHSLQQSVDIIKPSNALCFTVGKKDHSKTMDSYNTLSASIKDTKFYIACNSNNESQLEQQEHFKKIHSIEDLERIISI